MRLQQLDSLRGIAALSVVCNHLTQTFLSLDNWRPDDIVERAQWFGIRSIIACGGNAVLIFFALSGFVLTLSFITTDSRHYAPFAIKRVVRIYIPFACAILFAALLYVAVQPTAIDSLTRWFNEESWYEYPSFEIIVGHLLMTGEHRYQELDHVMWSLVHEMRIALIFPLIVILAQYFPRLALTGAIILGLAANSLAGQGSDTLVNSFIKTASYLYLFVAGALLYFHADQVQRFVTQLGTKRAAVWMLCCIAMFLMPSKSAWGGIVSGLGAMGFLVMCYADSSVQPFLRTKIPLWLGRISYSLYLLHLPIILAIVHLGYAYLPFPLLLAASLVASFAAAELSCRYIERPSARLGKLAAKFIVDRGCAETDGQKPAAPVPKAFCQGQDKLQ